MINSILRFLAHICLDMYIWLDPDKTINPLDIEYISTGEIHKEDELNLDVPEPIDEDECEW